MDFDILIIGLAAILTIIGAIGASGYRKRIPTDLEELEKMSVVAEKAVKASHARTIELLAHKISDNSSAQELEAYVNKMSQAIKTNPDILSMFHDLVRKYHGQALEQAKIQFWFSIGAATLGFLIIFYFVTRSPSLTDLELVIRSLPGATITIVAGLFFKQANETRQQAKEFFDRLHLDDEKRRAVALVESIDTERVRDLAKASLAMGMAGINLQGLDFEQLFQVANTTKKIDEDKNDGRKVEI